MHSPIPLPHTLPSYPHPTQPCANKQGRKNTGKKKIKEFAKSILSSIMKYSCDYLVQYIKINIAKNIKQTESVLN